MAIEETTLTTQNGEEEKVMMVAYGDTGLSDETDALVVDSFNQQTLNTPHETSSGPALLRTHHVRKI
jgi:hypothetical protein